MASIDTTSTTPLTPSILASAFAVVTPFFSNSRSDHLTPIALKSFFWQITPFLKEIPLLTPAPPAQISHSALQAFAVSLIRPLEKKRNEGGLSNIWRVAGLKRSELRISDVLANLWCESFAGIKSRNFLTEYLGIALPYVDWQTELARGYQIETEICPLGEMDERVDITIRSEYHLIAIEVKIDAGLGNMQLEKYRNSLKRSGAYQRRQSHVVFLAPFAASIEGVADTHWLDISTAAERAAGLPVRSRDFTSRVIAMFGDYVRTL